MIFFFPHARPRAPNKRGQPSVGALKRLLFNESIEAAIIAAKLDFASAVQYRAAIFTGGPLSI
jgi:hypothetical protein